MNPLPDPVITYFGISNGADASRVGDCFVTDATVTDEKQTHRGISAIELWQRQVREASTYNVTPLEASRTGDHLTVRTRVEGDFPGSPIELNHLFVLENDKIRSLEIRS